MNREREVLVFGATGQQGGSVANALLSHGWRVKAFVRDVGHPHAVALASSGAQLARGDLRDPDSIRAAMRGVYGVFSVQPSSGQGAVYNVSDLEEVAFGCRVADIAEEVGVGHLVYSSANAVGASKTGMGHFDSKAEIEAHIGGLAVRSTVIRPSAFMEILTLPGLGLDRGEIGFFMRPDQAMQFIAVEDIGRIVEGIFARPDKFGSRTFEIAGDAVTGTQLQEKFSRVSGAPIAYRRFPDELLEENMFLGRLARLVDEGRLSGSADIEGLRGAFPELLDLDRWLAGSGRNALRAAMRADSEAVALR